MTIDRNGEPMFTSMYEAMADTLHKEIVDHLTTPATQAFGQALMRLCVKPQCHGHEGGTA